MARGSQANPPQMQRWATKLLPTMVLAAVYVAAGRAGLLLYPASGFATLVWAPTGISLVALLVFGKRLWPGVALGAFVVNVWIGAPFLVASAIAAGNSAEAVLGAYALEKARFDCSLSRVRDALGLILLASLLSTLVSATVGALSLLASGLMPVRDFWMTWRAWWLGDALGDLVVAPLILTWINGPRLAKRESRYMEAAALCAAVVLLHFFVSLSSPLVSKTATLQRPYLWFPLLVWATVRFGLRGTATFTFFVSASGLVGTALGRGPFQRSSVYEGLMAAQAYTAVVALTGLMFGAVVAERERTQALLRESREGLERTVMKRTEELRRREAQLAEAQRIAQVGSWHWDIPTDQISWSEELQRIHGVSPEDFGATFHGLLRYVHPDDRRLVQESVDAAMHDGTSFSWEHRIMRPDGSVRILETHGDVHRDARGKPALLVGICQDVTDAKKVRHELERSVREKDILLREVSHRVKNNLQIVSSLLALQSRALGDPLLRDVLDDCDRRIRVISLAHEALCSGPCVGSIDMAGYLASIVHDLVCVRATTPTAIEADVDSRTCVLQADLAIPCALIVNELVTNALKHAFPRGRPGRLSVSLRAEPGEAQFLLEVRDDGVGFPPEVDPHHATRTLGLSLVKGLTEQLGGTVELERGGGSCFRVRFPAQPGERVDKRSGGHDVGQEAGG